MELTKRYGGYRFDDHRFSHLYLKTEIEEIQLLDHRELGNEDDADIYIEIVDIHQHTRSLH